jgi:chromosome segregation ATPase
MIEKTASLSLIVKEMDATRTSLEDIAKRHHSYFAELNTVGQSEAGRTLTASLRVPADELDATLAELRKLGQLSEEKQGGEEVSQQYVDLKARLDNARHTEKRLTELLTKRADKLKDVLDVEREIASTREDIERMEAQQRNIKNQVSYASIDLKLRQEYKPALHLGPPAIGTRLRNALVDGYHSAVESALGLVLFLFQEGPSILFWLLVLFFPARWTLRKLRAAAAQKHSMAGAL